MTGMSQSPGFWGAVPTCPPISQDTIDPNAHAAEGVPLLMLRQHT